MTTGDIHMMMEAELEEMSPQTKKSWQPLEGRRRKGPLLFYSSEKGPALWTP
jgi:hypothetical protein